MKQTIRINQWMGDDLTDVQYYEVDMSKIMALIRYINEGFVTSEIETVLEVCRVPTSLNMELSVVPRNLRECIAAQAVLSLGNRVEFHLKIDQQSK